jgi:hypothetical protein
MAGNRIDIGSDDWNFTFVKDGREYSIDSLVYTSMLLERSKGDENPPREVVISAMRDALTPNDCLLTDHDIWGMSVRLAKAMGKAGNA